MATTTRRVYPDHCAQHSTWERSCRACADAYMQGGRVNPGTNHCTHCGSDDLQKADDIMAHAVPPVGETATQGVAQRREASALRASHMNGACAR